MEADDTQIMIAGNLGDDPELRSTRLGSPVKVTKAARSTAGAAQIRRGFRPVGGRRRRRLLRHSAFLTVQARSRAGAFPDRHDSITRECRRYALPS